MPYNAATSRPVNSPDGDTNTYFYDTSQGKFFTIAGSEVTDSEKITTLSFINLIRPPSGNAVAINPEPIQTVPFNSTESTNTSQVFGQQSSLTFQSAIEENKDTLKYPLLENTNDYILFTPMELNLNSGIIPSGNDNNNGFDSRFTLAGPYGANSNRRQFAMVKGGGSVVLGIQGPISDQNLADWGSNNVGIMDAILYNSAMKGLNAESFAGGLQSALEKVGENTKDAFDALIKDPIRYKSLFSAMAANNPGLFNRATGLAVNPNMELIFNGPSLRQFSFNFLLSGYHKDESREIKSIIKFFKYHMAPKVNTGTGLFLKTPNVFSITYMNGKDNKEHNSIGRIAPNREKACALKAFSVDYTPLGSYMTYEDAENSLVAYNIKMDFQEIVPVYDVDYVDNHPIGY